MVGLHCINFIKLIIFLVTKSLIFIQLDHGNGIEDHACQCSFPELVKDSQIEAVAVNTVVTEAEKLKQAIDSIEREAGDLLLEYSEVNSDELELNSADVEKGTIWDRRIGARDCKWNDGPRVGMSNARKESAHFEYWNNCFTKTPNVLVVCSTCMQELCPCCDIKLHQCAPSHK